MKIQNRLREIVNHDGISFAYYHHKDAAAPMTASSTEDEETRRQNIVIALQSEKLGEVAEGVDHPEGLRVLIGDQGIAVFRKDAHCVILVYLKGHSIVKSIQRLGRRLIQQAIKEALTAAPAANTPAPDALPDLL